MELTQFIETLLDVNTQFNFIPSNLFILIVALLFLGTFFKIKSSIADELIPNLLLVFSCICSMLLCGFNATALLQGIICWGVSIAIHQLYIQNKKYKNKK